MLLSKIEVNSGASTAAAGYDWTYVFFAATLTYEHHKRFMHHINADHRPTSRTNLWCTVAISWKILSVSRSAKAYTQSSGIRKGAIVAIIAESAALYT